MKRSVVMLLALSWPLSITSTTDGHRYIILLENEVLKIVDGKKLAINGTTIGMMLHLRSEIGKRRFGVKQSNDIMRGLYDFKNKLYTLIELADLEETLITVQTLENYALLEELRAYLDAFIKEDFIKLVEPFLADARGAKDQMVVLITEWATKAQRLDTKLLTWAHTPEGNESQELRERIKSIKNFNQFCADLVNFLESLMRSCPKACQQYKLMVEKQKEKQQQK